jgi:hypothetical protein
VQTFILIFNDCLDVMRTIVAAADTRTKRPRRVRPSVSRGGQAVLA